MTTFADAYPGVEPLRAGDITAYRGADRWHMVTTGLARFGREISVIVPPSEHPPDWATDLLLGIARVVLTVERGLHDGARMAPGLPIGGSDLVAVAIRADPLVDDVLQAVGITEVEYRLMQQVGTQTVLEKLALRDPLLRTDPARAVPGTR